MDVLFGSLDEHTREVIRFVLPINCHAVLNSQRAIDKCNHISFHYLSFSQLIPIKFQLKKRRKYIGARAEKEAHHQFSKPKSQSLHRL